MILNPYIVNNKLNLLGVTARRSHFFFIRTLSHICQKYIKAFYLREFVEEKRRKEVNLVKNFL